MGATEKDEEGGAGVGRQGRKEDECRLRYKKRPTKNRMCTQNDEEEDARRAGVKVRTNDTMSGSGRRELGERRRSVRKKRVRNAKRNMKGQ